MGKVDLRSKFKTLLLGRGESGRVFVRESDVRAVHWCQA